MNPGANVVLLPILVTRPQVEDLSEFFNKQEEANDFFLPASVAQALRTEMLLLQQFHPAS
jgi:hypothetical protein